MAQTIETQAERRVKYGLNVFVALTAAIGIVVLINWISYRNFRTGDLRWDVTLTRQHSLSPLTQRVMDRLDSNYRIVTLFEDGENSHEVVRRLRDLVAEYDRSSPRITVDQINPGTEPTKLEEFKKSLHAMFQKQFEPLATANRKGLAAMDGVEIELEGVLATVRLALKDSNLKARETRSLVLLNDTERLIEARLRDFKARLISLKLYTDVAMPDYAATRLKIKQYLEFVDANLYPALRKSLVEPVLAHINEEYPKAQFGLTAAGVTESMLTLQELVNKAPATRQAVHAELAKAASVPSYDSLFAAFSKEFPIILISPKDVKGLSMSDLFTASDDRRRDVEREKWLDELKGKEFLGEERLSGALAQLTMASLDPPPMVVFVATGSSLATTPRREYTQLMERLRGMGLQVEVWDPVSKSPFVAPDAKPKGAPQVKPGQKAVWVVLPGDPPDANNPFAAQVPATVAMIVRDRLDKGDGVLLFVPPEVDQSDMQKLILQEHAWNIKVDYQRVILREMVNRFGKPQPDNRHDVRLYPREHPVSKAAADAGMAGQFAWASPITLPQESPTSTIKYWPLVSIAGANLWANYGTAAEIAARKEPTKGDANDVAGDRFIIACAAERPASGVLPDQRLVVFTDRTFATDQFGAEEFFEQETGRTVRYTRYPANHELFVNSVCWLAGLEELIAAGARSQDVRRIMAMEPAKVQFLQTSLVIGMPLGVFVIGMAVWYTRRG
ncbi:MAG: hypothetical protein WD768_02105 [Phycisphaeraceae bacterium]